jgi:hypothetical protein
LPFGRAAAAPAAGPPALPLPPKSGLVAADREKSRALGFFCGALTRDGELYAEAGAGAAAFAHYAGLARRPDSRAELHKIFADACLAGAHVKHVREFDGFINHSPLADRDLALELTHALRIVLAREWRAGRIAFEGGTERSAAVFKHLLSLARRAPDVFATLASPEGRPFDLRAIQHRLLDERLDHAENLKTPPPPRAITAEEIASQIGLNAPYTPEAVQAARRFYAARWHPDRAPAHKRQQATQALAMVNAALDEIAGKLAG